MFEETEPVPWVLTAISFRDQHLDRLAEQFRPVVAEQLFRLTIDQSNQAFPGNHQDAAGRCFDDDAETLFGAFALSDIDDAGENECAFVGLNWVEPDLDWHFTSVFAAAKKIAAGPHRTSGWMLEETLPVSGMYGAETFRNQHLHGLAQQLILLVTKELSSSFVGHGNRAMVGNHEYRAGSGFKLRGPVSDFLPKLAVRAAHFDHHRVKGFGQRAQLISPSQIHGLRIVSGRNRCCGLGERLKRFGDVAAQQNSGAHTNREQEQTGEDHSAQEPICLSE